MNRVYNFSSGPSMLPLEVLEKAASEMTNYQGSGMSVMEMSHRSKIYDNIFNETESKLRKLMSIPENYKVLFLQGGATLQFAMVPMNLMQPKCVADYALTGTFSTSAYKEALKYGTANVAADSSDKKHSYIPAQADLKLDASASYFHYCENNTIYGTEWSYIPNTADVTLVCDMSSNILSKPVDVSKYGLIYAGAQKNMAPAGLTVVIMRDDLAGREFAYTPVMMNYAAMIKAGSMYNTPPAYDIYIMGMVLDWVNEQGGLEAMKTRREEKSSLLYSYLDSSAFYRPHAEVGSRSMMNVTFRTPSDELDTKFANEAASKGLVTLKGHRSVGGLRASIYNAMPAEGVKALISFMENFEKENK